MPSKPKRFSRYDSERNLSGHFGEACFMNLSMSFHDALFFNISLGFFRSLCLLVGESWQPWVGVFLGPIVFFQKV